MGDCVQFHLEINMTNTISYGISSRNQTRICSVQGTGSASHSFLNPDVDVDDRRPICCPVGLPLQSDGPRAKAAPGISKVLARKALWP